MPRRLFLYALFSPFLFFSIYDLSRFYLKKRKGHIFFVGGIFFFLSLYGPNAGQARKRKPKRRKRERDDFWWTLFSLPSVAHES